ncbi:MAG: hypothetical protein H0S85_10680 [Desulfovibrionaceae bacterium]|jgi:hypothetical protein|nr:hypothetical protein [Desulfovibrionaceae bacterium]
MYIGSVDGGFGGLVGAFEKQREDVEHVDKASTPGSDSRTAAEQGLDLNTKVRELASAVTGIGTKLDVDV